MRKSLIPSHSLLSAATLLLATITVSAAAPSVESAADLTAAAQQFISTLQQGKFEDAEQRLDATMQKALPARMLQTVWESTVATNGKFQKFEPGRANHVDKWDVVDTPCVFEKSTVVVRITFDNQRKVSGLYVLPSKKPNPNGDDGVELQLKTATGTLYGTLELPAGKGPWPVALVIAGSGPTDRDGNQPFLKNDSLKLLGKALVAHGVATLRYDKRGIGKSAASGAEEDKLRFENHVDDATDWVKQLRGDRRFNKIVVVGHSEGSLIGILVAKREPIDALVSIAGTGRDLATLLRDQLQLNLPAELRDKSNQIIDELVAGRKVDDVPAELTTIFRPSVQPFLMTWLKYNPAQEIAGLKLPILVVQGTTDLQVSLDDAKLLVSNNKSSRLVAIEHMNHVLKSTSTTTLAGQAAAYSDPSLPLAPHLADEILSFAKQADRPTIPADSR